MNQLHTKIRSGIARPLILTAASFLAFSVPAAAIEIELVFDSDGLESADFDPNADKLKAIMEEAAATWESIITDSRTVTITYRYAQLQNPNNPNSVTLANAAMTDQYPNDNPKAGVINVASDTPNAWYFDPRPWENEHWTMVPKLYRDLGAQEQSIRFNRLAPPPDVLEVSYRGAANADAPVAVTNGYDLYSTAMHEIGHILGLNSAVSEGDPSDFLSNPVFSGGDAFRPKFKPGSEGAHLESSVVANRPLMCGGCGELGARRLPTALDVISIATRGKWGSINLPRKDFLGAVGVDFNTEGNWMGNQTPDSGEAFVRGAGLAELSRDIRVNSLYIGGQSIVDTQANSLAVNSVTVLIDDQAGGLIKPMLLVPVGGHLETRNLNIGEGTIFALDLGSALVTDVVVNEGELQGRGAIDMSDGLSNDGGVIQGMSDGLLTLRSGGGVSFDLDGRGTRESGTMEAHWGDVSVEGRLTDPFRQHDFGVGRSLRALPPRLDSGGRR